MATAELESLHPLRKNNKRSPIWRQPALCRNVSVYQSLGVNYSRWPENCAPRGALWKIATHTACVDIDYGVFTSIRDKSIIISIHGLPRGLLAVSEDDDDDDEQGAFT